MAPPILNWPQRLRPGKTHPPADDLRQVALLTKDDLVSAADLPDAAAWLPGVRRVAVLTGAGISTDSGIPDFRGPAGLWTKDPAAEKMATYQAYVADPAVRRRSWQARLAHPAWTAQPNAAHRALARLVADLDMWIITQNIDGLHQAAGVPAERVVELHGNTTWAHCLDCARRYELADLRRAFERDATAPVCADCGGFVKTATISFGQAMPERAMRRAETETIACDLFIVAGSSLVVYPAAGFPELAKRYGAALVIVNREPTPLDGIADLVLHRAIGETLGGAVGVD